MSYTKGEWSVSYNGELDGYERYSVCTNTMQIAVLHPHKDPQETEANAHLITAAPGLLAALKFAMPYIAKMVADHVDTAIPPQQCLDFVNKWIALAEGEVKQ